MQEKNIEFEKFICGFVAGEGYFSVSISYSDHKRLCPQFGIKLATNDKEILLKIQKYLGCGVISSSEYQNRKYTRLLVSKREDLRKIIIPFFERNPMSPAKKQESFNKWKTVMDMIYNKEDLNLARELALKINEGGKSHGNQWTKRRKN